MSTELYLDTARLGRMCPEACKAEQDFATLVSQSGSGLYLEDFLSHGFSALPLDMQTRLVGLASWRGLADLQYRLRDLTELDQGLPVFFAGQSKFFLRALAPLLFQGRGDVLATDLDWPPYLEILQRFADETGRRLCVLSMRERVFKENVDANDIIDMLRTALQSRNVAGLFLTDIGYQGVRLPVGRLLAELPTGKAKPFVVCDGAQALHHRPVSLKGQGIDAYLAGTQKWVGGYHPLRICFCGSAKTANLVDQRLRQPSMTPDGLFEFCNQLQASCFPEYGETVNLIALMTASAALNRQVSVKMNWDTRLENHQILTCNLLRDDEGFRIQPSLRSGICLWQPRANSRDCTTPRMKRAGVTTSSFRPGTIRVSMPSHPMSLSHFTMVRRATLGSTCEA